MDDKQIGMGIVASIFTGTIATIFGGIILNCIPLSSSGSPGDKPPTIENKPAPSQVAPTPFEAQPVPQSPPPAPVPLPVAPSDPQTLNALRNQLAAQQEEMDALKQKILELNRVAFSRKDSETNRPSRVLTPPASPAFQEGDAPPSTVYSSNPTLEQTLSPRKEKPTPQQAPVFLYYRVSSQRTRQVEYVYIDEIKYLLKSMNLAYVCGQSWKDSGLSPLQVPISICRHSSWQFQDAKSEVKREKIMNKMFALGIETRIEKPEDIED